MSMEQYALGWQHMGIPTQDMDESVKFYESIGFRKAYSTRYGTQDVSFMRMKDMTVELYTDENAAMRSGAIDHICINVSDIDAVFKVIQNGSFKLLDKAVDSRPFWENGVRFFTIEGPNKEKVEFNQYL